MKTTRKKFEEKIERMYVELDERTRKMIDEDVASWPEFKRTLKPMGSNLDSKEHRELLIMAEYSQIQKTDDEKRIRDKYDHHVLDARDRFFDHWELRELNADYVPKSKRKRRKFNRVYCKTPEDVRLVFQVQLDPTILDTLVRYCPDDPLLKSSDTDSLVIAARDRFYPGWRDSLSIKKKSDHPMIEVVCDTLDDAALAAVTTPRTIWSDVIYRP